MTIDVRARLAELGLKLPEVSSPKGAYIPAVQVGDLIFVAGQIPLAGGELIATGSVGAEIEQEQARNLSRQCVLSALAAIDAIVGVDRVVRVVKVTGYVSSADNFTGQAGVVDGASDLLVEVFGRKIGSHARTSVGVAILPLDAPVEIEVIVAVNSGQ